MIVFSGFMQAATGFTPAPGGQSIAQENRIEPLTDCSDGALSLDEDAGAFIQWVQTLMDNRLPALADGEKALDHPSHVDESNQPAADPLEYLITETIDQSITLPQDPQTEHADHLNGQNRPGTQETTRVDVDFNGPPKVSGVPGNTDNSPTAAQPQFPAPGQAQRVTTPGTPLKGIAKEMFASTISDANNDGIDRSTQKRSSAAAAIADRAPESLPGSQQPMGEPSRHMPTAALKHAAQDPASVKPALTDGQGHADIDRSTPGRSSDGSEIAAKTLVSPPEPQPPGVDKANDPASRPAFLAGTTTDRKEASTSNDTANDRGRDDHRSPRPTVLADAGEGDMSKNQPLDAVKSTSAEAAPSRSVSQEGARAMTIDPSTNMAATKSDAQAVASPRPDASTERAFQSTVMDQIVDKAAMRSLNGRSEIQIHLKPEFLGNVQMTIATDKDQLTVRILADQPVVKDIIETHLHHLKTELASQGLTIDKFDVMVNPDADHQHGRDQFAQMFKHHSFQNGRRAPREENPEASNRGGSDPSGDDRPTREGINYFA